jgi:two-component system cell cycle response regulator DivK
VTGPRVLIVEDNEQNLRLAQDMLHHHGFQTVAAMDGLTGLALAATSSPDVVLLDIDLPDIDGREVLRRLRADPTTAHLTVVAVTAYAMEGDREALLEAGFDDYITKPISVRTFADQVRAHCRPAIC